MTQHEFNEITAEYANFVSSADWKAIALMEINNSEELKSKLDYYAQVNSEKAA